MGLQRAWLVGGAVAIVGVLLALPSVVAPTWHQTISDRERGALLSEQWEWSWGRSRLTGLGGVELQDLWNPLGLTIFVLLLGAAVAGVVLWVRGRPSWAVLAGLVGVAALAGRLVTTSAERHGRTLREEIYGASGLTLVTDTPGAGVLETMAAVVLLVALAAMSLTLVMGDVGHDRGILAVVLPAPTRHTSAGPGRGSSDRPDGSEPERPSASASLRPEGEHLSTAPVVFGDVPDEDGRP
jgi:hypothetical protein